MFCILQIDKTFFECFYILYINYTYQFEIIQSTPSVEHFSSVTPNPSAPYNDCIDSAGI